MASLAVASGARQSAKANGSPRAAAWLRRILFYLGLTALWQVIVAAGIWPPYVLPGPRAVADSLAAGFAEGVFLTAAGISLSRLLIGYAISLARAWPTSCWAPWCWHCNRCPACAGCRWPSCGSD
jgi:NitT/TauT family transport system permease protein